MELVIKEIKPLICLNMIVKDESHIIVDTLTKFLNKVSIDYWVISDTGSTDNTQEIIKTFFKKRDIPGELYEDKWENFAHNRTLALEHAHGKSDYIFVFDADDELCGDFQLPTLTEDAYHIQFGDANGTSYTRVLLVNNNTKKWRYLSVIHEFIDCVDNTHTSGVITGNYYCVSGRSGNRSKDPDKYLKDALVLEKAHAEALAKNDLLYFRYAFYCANSYFDYGKYMDAIKWYKITLGQGNWEQEKYVSCMKLFICYTILKQPEAGMFYLVKGILYDKTRVEGLFELVQYYCGNDMNELAYMYYEMVKEFYEKEYVKIEHTQDKLFVDISKANFHLPYWMIIVADRIKKYDTGIAMYRIIFTKKFKETNKMLIGNMLFNLQFFIDKVDKNDTQFFTLFKEYIDFLLSIQYPVFDHDFMINYEKYGIVVPKKAIHQPTFTKEECATSNKILIYTGFMNVLWNDSYVSTQSIGGAEKAVTYLSRYFPKNYEIIISGDVADEVIGNITYINRNKLQDLLEKEKFHTIVVSRYVSFFLLYRNFSCYQLFLSAHDSTGFINHVDNNILSVDSVILNWNYLIDGVITLTNWHKDNVIAAHPYLKDKMHIVNNGILTHTFPSCKNKIKNKFVWTSCSYRGLYVILHLWKDILENIPDATLDISSYNAFPENEDDVKMLEIMNKYNSIKHHGMLNTTQLYDLISKAEYWLYTNTFPETSCITGLEMLMSEVICLYYPLAGLLDTVGNYGIQVNFGNEINTILNLSEGQKIAMRKRGREYALSCSWENRAKEWCDVLFVENNTIKNRIYELHNIGSIPKNHVDFLKNLAIDFKPKVIYDIGANVLTWTREAHKIWSDSEIIAFDAIQTAEFFYKEQNLKYHIGVLSKEDNSVVKFYENIEHPAGNSYYKEIGHKISNELYPENAFTEQSTISLSSVVKNKNFPLPDLVKIDVQGSELDILRGGMNVINNAKYLIVELQDVQYNRGAPLADETIQFLYDNGWELIDKKFSDNGPDADYCFLNKNYKMNDAVDVVINKPKLVFFVNRSFILQPLIDYFDSLKEKYDITHTQNIDDLNEVTDALILFVIGNLNIDIGNYLNKNDNTIGLFNTEPLNIQCWLSQCIHLHMLYPTIKMYDYSNSNICILKNNNIIDVEYLPYLKTISENKYLTKIYSETPKIYDFGIISPKKTMPITPPRRNKILEYLINNGFTLNLITGWKEVRDNELAKCKFILNIHGQINENPDPTTDETSNIFEHIRCDRLLEAGFQILSEESLYLDPEFINKYPNLKLINYEDFFNLETYNVNDNGHEHFNFINNNILKNIYETLCSNKSPFNDIYVNPEDIYEHLPTLYKYANECESILECGVRGVVSSWAFLYGLMNNNKENKKIILNDITECNIQKILEYNNVGVTIEYKWINDLHLKLDDNVDLTFIDTWHVYGQLKRELDHFSKVTNKYIIMHDTTIDEYTSEAIRANLSDDQIYQQSLQSGFAIEEIKKGLWPAIEEFLENNTDWSLHERFKNNNGLTILKKQTPSIVVGSLQLLRLAPTEFNHSPSTSSTARSSM